MLSAVNSLLDTWDQSAGATLIERRLIDWTAARADLGPAADGVFTSGGSQSNLHALLLAREEAVSRGADPARLRVLVSECGHFSVQKAARLLGLPADAVIAVPWHRPHASGDPLPLDALAFFTELRATLGLSDQIARPRTRRRNRSRSRSRRRHRRRSRPGDPRKNNPAP